MNIAVFGWYHHRNAGDDRIQYCITRWLDGHTLAFLPAGRPVPVAFLRSYDAVILGGGGIVNTRGGMFRRMAKWVKAAGIPVALVGVSVERLPDDLRVELREFLDLCCVAWFRDRGSLEAVGGHSRAFVGPDLTWLFPFAALPPPASSDVAVSLRPHARFDPDRWARALDGLHGRNLLPWPLHFERDGDTQLLRRQLAGTALPEEFSIDPLAHARAAISMRFHGVLFALQSGRPVVAVGNQPKLTRFMSEAGLSRWLIDESDLDRLAPVLDQVDTESGVESVLEIRHAATTMAAQVAQSAHARLVDAAKTAAATRPRWARRVRAYLDSSFHL